MNKKLKATLVFAWAVTLSGCVKNLTPQQKAQQSEDLFMSQPAYRSAPNLSGANNVMHAAYVKDIKDAETTNADYVNNFASGFLNPAIAASELLLGNFSGLFVSLTPKPHSPSVKSRVLYWTPTGVDHIALGDRFEQLLVENKADFMPQNAAVSTFARLDARGGPNQYSLSGIGYKNAECEGLTEGYTGYKLDCGIAVYNPKIVRGQEARLESFAGTVSTRMPDFISPAGGVGKFTQFLLETELGIENGMPAAQVDTLSGLKKLSAELPTTAYIYLAPLKYTITRDDGLVVYGRAPFLLNQGKVLPFVVQKN